jgi:hypothetical protein
MMSDRTRMRSYKPRLGDGLATVYQPPAIKRTRLYGVHPVTLVLAMVAAFVLLAYVAPVAMVMWKALGEMVAQ